MIARRVAGACQGQLIALIDEQFRCRSVATAAPAASCMPTMTGLPHNVADLDVV